MTEFTGLECECKGKTFLMPVATRSIRCPDCGMLFSRMGDMVYTYNRNGYLLAQIKSTTKTPSPATSQANESDAVTLATSTDHQNDEQDQLNDVKDQL